ncbi:hypothetical protein TNIN_459401 [Trichonephila inaurata madagascariensis]|uniref:Uncharacterized protein n=1 Tax=Trichonephila inaurata madagascariensis TaxID=2747483 RepID=A0A8X6XQ97_9ARAC|nr:hypothetical protein TNIN_459401 [Trichonephila inaurata madagascariensis]
MRTVGLVLWNKKNFAQQWICHHQYHKSHTKGSLKIIWPNDEVADDSMKNAAKEEVSASGSNEIRVRCEKWRGQNLDIHMKVEIEASSNHPV